MIRPNLPLRQTNRRKFLRDTALGASLLAVAPLFGCRTAGSEQTTGPALGKIRLDSDWLFGGKFQEAALQPEFDDSAFEPITLPHCVAKLSWHNWKFSDWQDVWIYRRHFSLPAESRNHRVFLHFNSVMSAASPAINGHVLPEQAGGYLPFEYEITQFVSEKNTLAVKVDGRWQNAPPQGAPKGPGAVDFFEPAGITRSVSLHILPQTFIKDVFVKPVDVLTAKRRLELTCSLDAALIPSGPLQLKVELLNGEEVIASLEAPANVTQIGQADFHFTLSRLEDVKLWDIDTPQLYGVRITLISNHQPLHVYHTRVGFREARFEIDGFFLNGRRLQLFGLNRHELYPYVGFAMPPRVMRRDAEILRHELNCNIVRCSHYPQSEAFLDACDELGLLVFEEIPGWSYIGDAAWQEVLLRDVKSMIIRDRNRPSIITWGVRVNESNDNPELYRRTTALAKALDDSRPASGAMVGGGPERHSTKHWAEDVFAYNDYHHVAPDFDLSLQPPLPDVPYLITETVGQIVGPPNEDHKYRRAANPIIQMRQALYHAQAHDQVLKDPHYAGVVAWCAFEYASPMNSYQGIKCPGVMDIFRIPKLGAAFYQSQVDPKTKLVIQPNFYWDFGAQSPNGPGKNAIIFSNCERLELSLDGKHFATLQSDRQKFPQLKYPPFFFDLEIDAPQKPELRINGFVGDKLVLSKTFSPDASQDQFILEADDVELVGNGSDTTRLVFQVVDKYGANRAFASGNVSFEISGPGTIVGDNPFSLEDSGGAAAVWVRSKPHSSGHLKIIATHSILGRKSVEIRVRGGV